MKTYKCLHIDDDIAVLKEHILFGTNNVDMEQKIKNIIGIDNRYRLNNFFYFTIDDLIADLSTMMSVYQQNFNDINYQIYDIGSNSCKIILLGDHDINSIRYDDGTIRLYGDTLSRRDVRIESIPALLIGLKIIKRIMGL